MKTTINIVAIFVLAIVVGVIGFYLGIRKGADTMSTLASQNEVSGALNRINTSLIAIEKNDLSFSLSQHRRDMNSALFDLGSYAPSVPYWKCRERDKSIIKGAKNYLKDHPDANGLPPKLILDQALRFCQ